MAMVFFREPWYLQRNKHLFSYEVPEFQILESKSQFSDPPDIGIQKYFPTGIFGIKNGIGVLLTMGSQKLEPKIGIPNQANHQQIIRQGVNVSGLCCRSNTKHQMILGEGQPLMSWS
jgi:hypothetical protein